MAEEGGFKRLYPIIVGVALVGALFLLWSSRDAPLRAMPDEKEAGNPYLCTACGYSEELSPQDRAAGRRAGLAPPCVGRVWPVVNAMK